MRNVIVNLSPPGQFNNLTTIDFGDLVGMAINFLLIIAVIAFFFIIVTGGIGWITSGGDRGKIQAAQSQVTSGLIGLVIVFAAWAILSIIENFFGVNLRSFRMNMTGTGSPAPTGTIPTVVMPTPTGFGTRPTNTPPAPTPTGFGTRPTNTPTISPI